MNKNRTIALRDPITRLRIKYTGKSIMGFLGQLRRGGLFIYANSLPELPVSLPVTKVEEVDRYIEVDPEFYRNLNPKEWKDQDHYAVLGLKHLRVEATDDDIKNAYRKIILKHHPDKRKGAGEEIKIEDDYFTCIKRAYDQLNTVTRRRAYDSVDPEFDDSLPTNKEIEKNVYEVFNKYFKLNARWSEKPNVPLFGDDDSARQHVEKFYDFWYSFESWREFSYLDEENKDLAQDRDERRWIDKQNKKIRAERKKEENSRIRALVDLAYSSDPRIKKFKQQDKDKKQAAKRAKMNVYQAQKAEEDRIQREAQQLKEQAEQAEQKRIEQIRLEREQQKRALKREKKTLKDLAKANEYYSTSDKEKTRHMEGVEKICNMLNIDELKALNKELSDGGRNVFTRVLKEIDEKLEEERRALFDNKKSSNNNNQTATPTQNSAVKAVDRNAIWNNNDNIQLLIKAVNLFPAGTVQRWDVIANYMNQHSPTAAEQKFHSRDVLNKAKDLQNTDFTKNAMKVQANENAFDSFEKTKKDLKIVDKPDISENMENKLVNGTSETVTNGKEEKKTNGVVGKQMNGEPEKLVNGVSGKDEKPEKESKVKTPTGDNVEEKPQVNGIDKPDKPATKSNSECAVWSPEEQALLEQAIKTYPISTPDRWDRVAECVPNRTKKECLRRVKELVDRVNAKQKAQQIK